ncbi:hypothetical protein CYMTET_21752 [Cymbomonas tetramitiformis]|uniref:AP2/ERF domain-containing protein n=1 Tax=Cymbomonas tetramitiformis TaxID=36881 RepID=A0AAE0L2V2_9CHLO|nr:hypothetical protein CYMTET_21752 [Cymbomonas tetramitiformis]
MFYTDFTRFYLYYRLLITADLKRRRGGGIPLSVDAENDSRKNPPKSSRFRGVTLFRPTGKWRAQISASGKTTSLGDHDTEEEAARAFDRAAINKGGPTAITNYNISEYDVELQELLKMSQPELVATLRSRARRSGRQTSRYKGVTSIKQTGKWSAQLHVNGKQLHLGIFETEESAAQAYDRASIHKSGVDGETSAIVTNFDISEYSGEAESLKTMEQSELLARIAEDPDYSSIDAKYPAYLKADAASPSTQLQSELSVKLSPGHFTNLKKRSPSPISPNFACFPGSKERRTRMQPCRAAC